MMTYEQDPDVVRWGAQLFDTDPYSNYGYCEIIAQDDEENYYQEQYFEEDKCDVEFCNIENDELLAHVLQEELSQLALEEAPESAHDEEEDLQVSSFQPDWLDQPIGNYVTGQDCVQEEIEDTRACSSCSSPEEKSYSEDPWSYPLELSDEHALDGEVEKRLNQMVPIPHVPRINGEIPSIDEATLDHQRLLDRMQLYNLVELKVQGDGNCQFRALSDQFYRSPEHHEFVRQQVVKQLKSCPEIYEGYVPMGYSEYTEKISESGEWGDHVTLQAAADSYGVKIFVMTSFKDTCYIEILPNVERSKRVICLSFWAEVHYNSIYPQGEISFGGKRKKRWRVFRNKQLESPDEYQ